MAWRTTIGSALIPLAAAGFLSACHVHDHGHGAVYRPHHETVRTGPIPTRTTVVTPHRDGHRDDRYRRKHRYPGPGHSGTPVTAKRPSPPAHGLHGTQPGHLKHENEQKGRYRAAAALETKKRGSAKRTSSIPEHRAATPKSAAPSGPAKPKGGRRHDKRESDADGT